MNWLGGKEYESIPTKSHYYPGSGECFDFVAFDTRFYEAVHGFEKEGVKAGMLSSPPSSI